MSGMVLAGNGCIQIICGASFEMQMIPNGPSPCHHSFRRGRSQVLTKSNRRDFSRSLIAGGLFATAQESLSYASGRVKAVAFDAFPIFDPRPIFALAEGMFPGKGADLAAAWRTRQFEYSWLRTISNRYIDFWRVTEDALVFAGRMLKLDLTTSERARLMDGYLAIRCWPEAPAALRSLKERGIRLAFLSNMTRQMLEAGIRNSGLEHMFDEILSTDRVAAFKPDPRAYQMGVDTLRLKRQEILFAAFAGWDAAGAKSFGYPTFWVNRQNQPAEELGFSVDSAGETLDDLVRYLGT
jgi:2-haloacid dehalogenase